MSTEVELSEADGMRRRSVVNLDNLQLLHWGRLIRRIGRSAPETMQRICVAAGEAVGR